MKRPGHHWLPLLLLLASPLYASTTTVHAPLPVDGETDQGETQNEDTLDEPGIIPRSSGGVAPNQPVTPITQFPEKAPYEQALQELEQAKILYAKGEMEAASDMGLEAYDDLCSIHGPRGKRNRKKRAKIRAQRAQAATVYVDASLAYIRGFVNNKGNTEAAKSEGRARIVDLHDVAQDYGELNAKLNRAVEQMR